MPLFNAVKYFGLLALVLSGCTTEDKSNPSRTATEQLLISSAADRAAAKLDLHLSLHARVFLDTSNIDGTDSKYAIASIRSHLLQRGFRLTDNRKRASVIVEARSGALSTDRKTTIFGLPSFSIPVPLATGSLATPEVALYGKEEQNGVAKFAIVAYSTKSGALIDAQEPQLGFAHNTKQTILMIFTSRERDYLPDGVKEDKTDISPEQAKRTHLELNGNGYSPPSTTAAIAPSSTPSPIPTAIAAPTSGKTNLLPF